MWIFEFFAPPLELAGLASILLAALTGMLDREFFLEFMVYGYLFAAMISVGAVLQEEVTYRRYNDWRDVARLICFCFLEQFPYRQLHLLWRLQGLWQYMRGDVTWQAIERVGLESPSASRAAPS